MMKKTKGLLIVGIISCMMMGTVACGRTVENDNRRGNGDRNRNSFEDMVTSDGDLTGDRDEQKNDPVRNTDRNSREDDEIVGGASEDAGEAIKDVGRDAVHGAKEIGKDVADGAKDLGHDAARGVDDLSDNLTDSSEDTKNRDYKNVNSVTAGEE